MSKDIEITVHGWVAAPPYTSKKDDGYIGFASFPIIHTERFRDASGEWKNGRSITLRAKAWGVMADNIARSIDKGQPVIACGRLTVEYWEDGEGATRQDTVLRLTSIGHDLSLGTAGFRRTRRSELETDANVDKSLVQTEQEREKAASSLVDGPLADPDTVPFEVVDQAEISAA